MKKLIFSLLAVGLVGSVVADDKKVVAKDAAKACPKECPLGAAPACADQAKGVTKVSFKIADVGCEESCGKLSKTIAGLKGVSGQAVCAKSQTASIDYKAGETCTKTLQASLIQAGFKVEGQEVALKVKDLHCEVGAAGLKSALTQVKGVKTGDVCMESGTVKVLFDPAQVESKDLVAVIAKEGYSVEK